jgi:hypothetical protein
MEEIQLYDDEYNKLATLGGFEFTDMFGNKKLVLNNLIFTNAGYHFLESQQNGEEIKTIITENITTQ